jgi:hypothetical protein
MADRSVKAVDGWGKGEGNAHEKFDHRHLYGGFGNRSTTDLIMAADVPVLPLSIVQDNPLDYLPPMAKTGESDSPFAGSPASVPPAEQAVHVAEHPHSTFWRQGGARSGQLPRVPNRIGRRYNHRDCHTSPYQHFLTH